MKVSEVCKRYPLQMHYAKDIRQFRTHQDCDVIAYSIAGDMVRNKNRTWAIIYRGPRSIFCWICGHRSTTANALGYIEGFDSAVYREEDGINMLKKQIAIEKI